jgi:hypothetical protein
MIKSSTVFIHNSAAVIEKIKINTNFTDNAQDRTFVSSQLNDVLHHVKTSLN